MTRWLLAALLIVGLLLVLGVVIGGLIGRVVKQRDDEQSPHDAGDR